MLQTKTFELSDKGSDAANAFIKTKRLIENGVQIRDNAIIVLYDNADDFDEKSREVALITKLSTNQGALLAAEIEREYYNLVEESGTMSPELMGEKQKNKGTIDNLSAQIFILNKMLGREVGEPTIFGKKQYKTKEKK